VARYAEQHSERTDMGITQSAIRLDGIEPLAELVGFLSDHLLEALGDTRLYGDTLLPALRTVQKFRDDQYVDLGHLARLLAGSSVAGPVATASGEIAGRLGDPASVVAAATRGGRGVEEATGLSIYLPLMGAVSPLYDDLDFARTSTWAKFLSGFLAT
jgi:hypothetical protein